MSRELTIVPDAAALAAAAAELICRGAAEAIASRGRFTLVLAGGHTPEQTYRLLTKGAGPGPLDWSRTFFFFGDERCVPHDDPRSNFAMVRSAVRAGADPAGSYPGDTDRSGHAGRVRGGLCRTIDRVLWRRVDAHRRRLSTWCSWVWGMTDTPRPYFRSRRCWPKPGLGSPGVRRACCRRRWIA